MSKPTHTIDAARYAHMVGPAMVSAEDLETYRRHTLEMSDNELDELIELLDDGHAANRAVHCYGNDSAYETWAERLEKLKGT